VFALLGDGVGVDSSPPPAPALQAMARAPMVNTTPLIFRHSLAINAELRMHFFKVGLVSGEQRPCRWASSRTFHSLGDPVRAAAEESA
jgi:hypothetical protein